jgi:transposase
MIEVGIDQHKRFSQVAALDTETGAVTQTRLEHDDQEAMQEFFSSLGGEVCASLETTGNWYWLVDLLEDCGAQVQLANTVETRRLIKARAKNDRLDAEALALLSHQGLLPQVYVPERDRRDERERHRFRIRLIALRTRIKNIVHSILSKQNVQVPFTDAFGRSGRAWLDTLDVREPYADQLRSSLRILDAIEPEIKRVREQIQGQLKGNPLAQVLLSAPGIGELSAYLILTEVGPVDRFASQKQFVSYCCLAPGTWQSGERTRSAPVGRHGNLYLKATLVSAVLSARRTDPTLAGYYRRICRRKGPRTARIATARRLAICIYHMLRKTERYRPARRENRQPGKPRLRHDQLS